MCGSFKFKFQNVDHGPLQLGKDNKTVRSSHVKDHPFTSFNSAQCLKSLQNHKTTNYDLKFLLLLLKRRRTKTAVDMKLH